MSRRKKDAEERILGAAEGFAVLALVALALAFVILCGGCRPLGTYAIVGNVDAPFEISDGTETVNIRALFSLTGAKVCSEKNTRVDMTYTNNYTNIYVFGLFERKGLQGFGVKVFPTADEAEQGQHDGTTGTSGTSETDAPLTAAEESGALVAPAAKRADEAE